VLRLFYIIPINKRKIVFVSWEGRQYACNPKYIFEYIYNLYPDKYIYVWSLRDKKKMPSDFVNVQICGYLTLKYFYSVLTAKYIITSHVIEPFFPIRKDQKVIYTWHGGGAYKKVYKSRKRSRQWSRLLVRDIRAKMITYVTSSCEKFSEIHLNIWNLSQDKFLPIGMPRNDMLFCHNMDIKEKVYKYFNIDFDKKLILYAPTYRGSIHAAKNVDVSFNIDVENLLNAFKTKYGETYLFLYREHSLTDSQYMNNSINVISASLYPDMQELLCAVNVLITDYSSSIWDFSFTFKPCFLYAPDVQKYQEDQGFYTPIEEWPFPLAQTNKQLAENIIHFDEEKYKRAVKKHHADLGSYEKGTACEQLYNILFN